MENRGIYHVPVLLKQSVEGLVTDPGGVYVDATFGGGGHSREILSRLNSEGRLYGFGQDADAMGKVPDDPRFTVVYGNFRYMRNFMRWYGYKRVNGILADLGVSWHHFDRSDRGFSFRFDGPVDMRMNQRGGISAVDVLNDYIEERLAGLFWMYGELRNGSRIAKSIVRYRQNRRITTVPELLEAISPAIGREREKKDTAKLFQALRMEVNNEVDALREFLEETVQLLGTGGRLAVITYHSIEDRMVKNIMKSGNVEGKVKSDFYGNKEIPFRSIGKLVVPDDLEQKENPRSRSAKLRIAERL